MTQVCKKCVTPSSRPRILFDNNGVCNACINSINKKNINWAEREKEFNKIVQKILKDRNKNNCKYDCVVPWSGGKDSTSIALKLKKNFNLNPLLVTFSPLIINEVGQYNREILLDEGFDSIFFRPNQKIAKLLARRFFIERGNPKVAWDAGINSIPLKIALSFKIPYIFYAEHGESEYGGLVLNQDSHKIRDYEEVIEHQIGDFPENWVDGEISEHDIEPYLYPKLDDDNFKPTALYFSYFFKWSMADNYDFVKKKLVKFKTSEFGRTCGTFTNFDSLDDKIDDLYYYMQYIKFGFGRCVRDASRLVQNNRISRKDAINYVKKHDGEFPKNNLDQVLNYLSLDKKEFQEIVDKHRNDEIWSKNNKNEWLNSWELKTKIF